MALIIAVRSPLGGTSSKPSRIRIHGEVDIQALRSLAEMFVSDIFDISSAIKRSMEGALVFLAAASLILSASCGREMQNGYLGGRLVGIPS